MKQFQKLTTLFIFTVAQPELLLATPLKLNNPRRRNSMSTVQWGHFGVSRYSWYLLVDLSLRYSEKVWVFIQEPPPIKIPT